MKQFSNASRPPQRRSGDIRSGRQQVSPAAQQQENTTTLKRAPVWMPRAVALPAWVLLPLRLFLGVTFVYAGLQKLTDPQYFRPSAPGYIGRQITGFAHGSPISGFLLHVAVPHATVFCALVAYGELAIGLATLVGFLMRLAAGAGLLLSLIFFLSASRRVYPYFYGADIVFVFGWITLVLAGPMSGGLPSLDEALAPRLYARVTAAHRASLLPALTAIIGVPEVAALPTTDEARTRSAGPCTRSAGPCTGSTLHLA
jgi:thiosulfate dehydrogenase [quinone] large subunit